MLYVSVLPDGMRHTKEEEEKTHYPHLYFSFFIFFLLLISLLLLYNLPVSLRKIILIVKGVKEYKKSMPL